MQYQIWRRNSITPSVNFYFGKLYNSASLKLRYDIKGRFSFFVEPIATINRFDYYKSSSALLDDVKPAYLIQSDQFYGGNIGFPARNRGKLILSGGYFRLRNSYYQTRTFSQEDFTDETRLEGGTTGIMFERNTLNRKMYSNQGTFFNVSGRFVSGRELTTPGTTGLFTDTINQHHEWMQLKITYDNYFKTLGRVKLGFYNEILFSNQPFFANYTASILSAQAYQPVAQSRTLFLEDYHTHNYVGAGLKSVLTLNKSFEMRLEAHIFQPFQQIVTTTELKAKYGSAFSDRSTIGSLALVYHSPVGPASLSLNYYEHRKEPFSVLFHFGYILFNKRALE